MENLEYMYRVATSIGLDGPDEVYLGDTLYMCLGGFIIMCCMMVPMLLFFRLIVRCFFSNLTERYWWKEYIKSNFESLKGSSSDDMFRVIADEIEKVEDEDSERGRFFLSIDTEGRHSKNPVVVFSVKRWITQNCAAKLFSHLRHLGLGVKLYRRHYEWKTPPADIEEKMEIF